jgi:Uncharacterised protein family (UPF0236)
MGAVSVVSLDDVRQARLQAEARQRLHEHFDRWLEQVEGCMKEQPPTLQELVQAVFALRQELLGPITQSVAEQAHRPALGQGTAGCPHCGRMLAARGPVPRTVETLVGAVTLERPYFYCVPCQVGFSPVDEALELLPRRKQGDLQKAAARLATEVPYDTAAELFQELTGLTMSNHTMHEVMEDLTTDLTVLDVSPTATEVQQKVAQVAQGKTWRPILVLAIDGADVPTRPETAKGRRPGRRHQRAKRAQWTGEWREAKGFRFYLIEEERIEHLLSWHQVQTDEELGAALQQVKAAGLIPEEAVRPCIIGDGAPWIWKQAHMLFPAAVEILDYYHCCEHLHQVAVLQYGDHPERQSEWYEATLARLFWGEVDGVIWGLQRMKPRDAQAAVAIAKLLSYLQRHRKRVNYRFARKGGYPIGSGGIESANKAICHVRLKRSGAWWYVENANQMLALRCAKYNGTFNRVFEAYQQKAKQRSPGFLIRMR